MKFFRKTDWIVALIVLAVAAAGLLLWRGAAAGKPAVAEIYFGRALRLTVPLTGEAQEFSLPERPNVVLHLEDGAIWFLASDCPDQICVHAGRMDTPGQTAACLPNDIIVKLVAQQGAAESGPDIIVG